MVVRMMTGDNERIFDSFEILGGRVYEGVGHTILDNGHIKADNVEFFGRFRIRELNEDVIIERV